MTDWSDISNLTPYDHLATMAVTCAGLLRDIAAMSGEITSDDEVQELLTSLITNVAPAWMQAWDELMLLLEHERGAAA